MGEPAGATPPPPPLTAWSADPAAGAAVRAALTPPAAALGSRALLAPRRGECGAAGPRRLGYAFRGGAEGCGGRTREPKGPSPRGSHGKGSGVGPGRASLLAGLLADRARRAHLCLREPWSPAPLGKIWAPGAWGAEVLR